MSRGLARIRRGAEEGVAQVLTPAETLALLDRLDRAEAAAARVEDTRARTMDCEECGGTGYPIRP